jgi:hypothetical protein
LLVTIRPFLAAAALSTGLSAAYAAEPAAPAPTAYKFSQLAPASADEAKARCEAWLQKVGKFDPAAFAKVWAKADAAVLDRVAESLALGSPEAKAALADLARPETPPPADAPAVLKDDKLDPFFRTNFAVAFARGAGAKKAYEEALTALEAATPELAVDPAACLFFKAAAEHALMKKDEAITSLKRFRSDVPNPPARYAALAELMEKELGTWSPDPKALTNIEKLMDNSGRRLDLSRPGETTQTIQKKIVFRLDEQIKEMENKAKGQSQANAGNCPNGGGEKDGQQQGNALPNKPADESRIMGGKDGEGKVDDKVLRKHAENWGTMPKEQRDAIIEQINREIAPKYRATVEEYFKNLNRLHGFPNK